MKKHILTLIATASLLSGASAQEYILPVDAEASSSFLPNNEDSTIQNAGGDWIINQNSKLTLSLIANAERWVSAAGDLAGGILDGGADPAGAWISFDLGGQYNLSALQLQNGATLTTRNVENFDVEVSNDNASWASVTGGSGFTAAQGSGWQQFDISASDVRYVRINVSSNYGDANYVNLSKVLFEGTPNDGQFYVDMSTVAVDTGTLGNLTGYPTSNLLGVGINSILGNNFAGVTATDIGTQNWISEAGQTTGEIIFTLAENTDLQSVLIWNGNDDNTADRGVNQFDLLVSPTTGGDDFVEVVTDDNLGLTSNSNIWTPGQNVLIATDNVRRVKLRIDTNHTNVTYTMLQGVQLIGRGVFTAGSGSIGSLGLTESSPGVFTVNFDVLTTTDLGTAFTAETLAPGDVSVVGGGIEVDISSASDQLFLRVEGN